MKTRMIRQLTYCEKTGNFYRNGKVAGWKHKKGYIRICVGSKIYQAHRLAWFYFYGDFPSGQIDHIDRDPANNRIDNLRIANTKQNCTNRKGRQKKSGYPTGVSCARRTGRWLARIKSDGVTFYLGTYKTMDEAAAAYDRAHAKKLADVFKQ